MTNKERINKMSCKEFADKFTSREQCCEVCAYWDKERNYCNSCYESNVDECKDGFIKWLSQETELTADEMFEELEYAIQLLDAHTIKYRKITKTPYVEIRLHRNTYDEWEYEKYFVEEDNESELITQKEDKAIHKKIEELKKC